MSQGYDIQGRRINAGGFIGAHDAHVAKRRLELAIVDRAKSVEIPEDETILDPVRTYHQHIRSIVDGHIQEAIALRDSSSDEDEGAWRTQKAVIERLQALREEIFNSRYEEPAPTSEDQTDSPLVAAIKDFAAPNDGESEGDADPVDGAEAEGEEADDDGDDSGDGDGDTAPGADGNPAKPRRRRDRARKKAE